jgi:hypothetical protein
MAWDSLARGADEGSERHRDRWIAVYIAVLAVILALCTMGGDNAAKEATRNNIAATDTWAFFQAKNIRRQALRLAADELEIVKAGNPALPAPALALIEAKIEAYRAEDQALTSEPETGEGLDELFAKAKALEAERDRALRRDPYFDYAQAALQMAIVLASVAIISGGAGLLIVSGLLGAAGALLCLNGFTLAIALPFFG